MLTQQEIRNKNSKTREITRTIVDEQSFGYNSHTEITSGNSNTTDEFSALQIIGNPSTPDTATITYTTTGKNGKVFTKTDLVAYVGDIIYGYRLTNITHSSGDAVIRAYYA